LTEVTTYAQVAARAPKEKKAKGSKLLVTKKTPTKEKKIISVSGKGGSKTRTKRQLKRRGTKRRQTNRRQTKRR
jgi:hypothetical protein